jgi:GNAT superfamily N-acetyltransferase
MADHVRRLEARDHDALAEIYRQAVLRSTTDHYSKAQQRAWAQQSEILQALLSQGDGFVSCNASDQPLGFSLRHPSDRLALLYCHPKSQRQGIGRRLIEAVEQEAVAAGLSSLRTEASLISKSLFEQLGWQVSWREELRIAGVPFLRFRMHKHLQRGY